METNRCINCMSEMHKTAGKYCPVCGFDNQSAEAPIYALKPNSILHGRYLIGRVLGQGGFGITYVGLDMVLDIKVAVKEYFPMGLVTRDNMSSELLWNASQVGSTQRQSGCESFLKEARKMAKTDANPTIVRVRDTFLENETAYIIMDFVEGHTLKKKLQQGGPIPFPECMQLLRPMMEGLKEVHHQGIIHRDISPDNIIIQPDGSVKLLDLGAAKDMTASNGQTSQVVAKKGFSPLEQYVEKGEVGTWTDVYALCATIYYCITGKVLPDALERMYGEQQLQIPETVDPLPEHVVHTLEAGLAIKVQDRIQNIEELLQRLDSQQNQPSMQPQQAQPVKPSMQQTEHVQPSMQPQQGQAGAGQPSMQPQGTGPSMQQPRPGVPPMQPQRTGPSMQQQAPYQQNTANASNNKNGVVLAVIGIVALLIAVVIMVNNSGNTDKQEDTSEQISLEEIRKQAAETDKEEEDSNTGTYVKADNETQKEKNTASQPDYSEDTTDDTDSDDTDSDEADPKPEKKKKKEKKKETKDEADDTPAKPADSEYILPEIDTKVYSLEELQSLSDQELYLARNELYARHGYQFSKQDLQLYFGEKSWYTPTTTEVLDKEFNEYELANRDLILFVEEQRK